MSDQHMGQKMVEEHHLDYFLDAYEWVTCERLSVAQSHERPDFVCQRPDRSYVGVELTRVMRDPESRWVDETFHHRDYMAPHDAIAGVNWAIGEKEGKRQEDGWIYPDATILVVQLMDCPIGEFGHELRQEDVDPHGFIELWLADFTGIDAYDDVELFSLYPPQRWGHHERPNAWRKPYG